MRNNRLFQLLGRLLRKEKKEATTTKPQKAEISKAADLSVVHPDKSQGLFDSEEERTAVIEKIRQDLLQKSKQENSSYDPMDDPEVSQLLQNLSKEDRSEFFRVRERSMRNRRDDETLSQRDLDILNLRAMQRSAAFSAVTLRNEKSVDWNSMPTPDVGDCRALSFPEILLLAKINGKSVKKFHVPGYFTHDYNLDLNDSIKTMFSSGFICYADFETCLEAMTVKELQKILAECGLTVGGNKSALIVRILTHCDPALWETRIDKRITLTEKGRKLIDQNDVLIYCQNNSGVFSIKPDEAGALRTSHPDWSMYQIVRFILEKRGEEYLTAQHYGLYRDALYGISQTYRHEGAVEKEKCYLLQCCYMDANGYGNGNRIEKRLAMLTPALIAELARLYRQGKMELDSDYNEALKMLPVPRTSDLESRALEVIKEALLGPDCN